MDFVNGFRDTGLFMLMFAAVAAGVVVTMQFVSLSDPMSSSSIATFLGSFFLFLWKEQILAKPTGMRVLGIALSGFTMGIIYTLMEALLGA
jgi:hypothetical protein